MGLVPHPQLPVLPVQEPPLRWRLADLDPELRLQFNALVAVQIEEERERVHVHQLPYHPVSRALQLELAIAQQSAPAFRNQYKMRIISKSSSPVR